MVHGSIDYDLEHLTRCHRVFFWSFCIIFCSFHNIIIHPEPFFAKKFGFFLLLCHRLGKQKTAFGIGRGEWRGFMYLQWDRIPKIYEKSVDAYGIKSRCFAGFASRNLRTNPPPSTLSERQRV